GMSQPARRHGQAGQLQPVAAHRGDQHRDPGRAHRHGLSTAGPAAPAGSGWPHGAALPAAESAASPAGDRAASRSGGSVPAEGSNAAPSAAAAARTIGSPGGQNGVAASAIRAPARATVRSVRPSRSLRHSNDRNAAGPTTPRPNVLGEPSLPAPSAPASVPAFQVRYRLPKVARNPARTAARPVPPPAG